jgi:transcription elongation factor Elf1
MDKTKHCISDIEENTVIPPKTEKLSDNDGLSENPPSQNSLPENLFYCTHCPYATEQIVKLQRHELKHTNKADNQCKVCTFSCRTIEILNQHMRLHSPEKQQVPSFQRDLLRPVHLQMDEQCQINSVPEESTKRHSETTLSAERRSDIFVCPHCPYKSKHGCDMKAHLKMHNEKNAHQCGQCSYSTKRLNALKSHEKLHDGVDQQLVNQAASNNVNMSNQKSRCLKLIKKDDKILGEKLEKINVGLVYLFFCFYFLP